MIDMVDISRLLTLHAKSYDFLMFLAKEAQVQPEILNSDVVAQLRRKSTCEVWMRQNEQFIPSRMRPANTELSDFAGLFSSFFATSFSVENLSFDGVLLDAKLKTGVPKGSQAHGVQSIRSLALKHLCGSRKIRLTDKEARQLSKGKSIHDSLTVWTYVWELDRRARGKAKGAAVHTLWRSMPLETRKNLSVEKVLEARETLLSYVQRVLNSETE